MTTAFKTYPNARGHVRGDENRGGLRVGLVQDNGDMQSIGLSGLQAVVTHESAGWVIFYALTKREDGCFVWQGPFDGLSEEIEETNS